MQIYINENAKNILINTKAVIDDKKSVLFFDTITIVPSGKNYRLVLSETGKFKLEEISGKEAAQKISKIVDKKILKGKKVQLNLIDGKNFLSDLKCKTNDSVLINFPNKKIEKCIPFKENAKVMIFDGKHSGKEGIIKSIKQEKKIAEVEVDTLKSTSDGFGTSKKIVNVLIKQFMVVE